MNANVIKEVEALNRIQARNNFPAVVDEDEIEAVESLVLSPGLVEVNGHKYLAAPLSSIVGARVWVACSPGNPAEEVSIYFDDEFFTEALPSFVRGDKFFHCQLRHQRKHVERLNLYTRKALELTHNEYKEWLLLNPF